MGGPGADHARTAEEKIPSESCPSGSGAAGTPWSPQRPRRPEAAFLGREGGRPQNHSDAFAFRTDAKVPVQHRLKHRRRAQLSVYQTVTAHSPNEVKD